MLEMSLGALKKGLLWVFFVLGPCDIMSIFFYIDVGRRMNMR